MSFAYFRIVTDRLVILSSARLPCSPAYLFATGSTPVPSDSEDSWTDYIPWHFSHGFTSYALPLTGVLTPAFAFGLRLAPRSRLIPRSCSMAYLTVSPWTTCSPDKYSPNTKTYLSRPRIKCGGVTKNTALGFSQ